MLDLSLLCQKRFLLGCPCIVPADAMTVLGTSLVNRVAGDEVAAP